MDGLVYITLDQAKEIHRKTIQYSGGGTFEQFDLGRLESVLQNIQNDDYYPTFEDKITHLFYCTCEFHCFADGNKRLAITLSAQFLLLNGYMAVAKRFFTVMENISYHVAAGKIKKEAIFIPILAKLSIPFNLEENEEVEEKKPKLSKKEIEAKEQLEKMFELTRQLSYNDIKLLRTEKNTDSLNIENNIERQQ